MLLEQDIITTLITAVLSSITVSVIVLLLYRNMKKTRYDSEIQKIQIEQMRHILEKEIYHLTERLVATESRFKDVNHLLLRTEKEIDSYKIQRQVKLNEFLTSNGITEDDLVVQKDFIFVLTPFHNEFLDDFATIKNVCSNVGLRCVRGDEQYFSGDIFPNILKQICKASLIIANINGRNPNVLYELGIVQALDKPVILISKSSNKIPADIKSKRFIIYKTEEELVLNLKSELIKIFINQ